MSRKRGPDDSAIDVPSTSGTTSSPGMGSSEYRSSPITDRSSTFIAVFSPVIPARKLQEASEFKSASHRIIAWRRQSDQRSLIPGRPVYDVGHDDDGEQYAGRRLEKLLNSMDVTGSVLVARWYGGILLGPVRFDHIENCAREAIRQWRQQEMQPHKAKKARLEGDSNQAESSAAGGKNSSSSNNNNNDEASRKIMAKVLRERDESITALRGLLAEKQGRQAGFSKPAATHKAPPMYDQMSLQVLRNLEKARDSTISWVLKEIDRIEGEQAARETPESRDITKKPRPEAMTGHHSLRDESNENASGKGS